MAAPFAYVTSIAALFAIEILWTQFLPAELPQGEFVAVVSAYEGYLKDINLYLLATQAALIGIVFPITLALVTFILQRDAAASESVGIRIYFSQSLARPVGLSGILMILAIAVHMVGYIHFPFPWPVLQVHSFIFVRMASVALHILWFSTNLVGLCYLLLFSLGFVSSENREAARKKFALRYVLPTHKRLLASQKNENLDSPLHNPALILEQLAEDVIAHLQRNAYTGYVAALDEMVRFHVFLLAEYERNGESLAKAGIRPGLTTSVEWVIQYNRIIRATVEAPNELIFLAYLANALLPLLQAIGVRDATLSGDVLVFYERLTKEIDSWAIANGVEGIAEELPTEAPETALVNLTRSRRSRYLNAVRVVDGSWMHIQTLWNRNLDEILSSGSDGTWEQVRPLALVQLDHLRRSLAFFAQAVWSGNHAGASFYLERLFAWMEDLNDYWYETTEYSSAVTPDIFQLPAEQVRVKYGAASGGAYKSLFEAAMRNAWRDSIILTVTIIESWRAANRLPHEHFRDLTETILENVPTHLGSASGFSGIFETFVRLCHSDVQNPRTPYSAHLYALVALIDGKSDRENRPFVRDRGPQTQWAFTAFLPNLLSLALSRGISNVESDNVDEWLNRLIQGHGFLPFGDGSLGALHYRFSLARQTLAVEQLSADQSVIAWLRELFERNITRIDFARVAALAGMAVNSDHTSRAADRITKGLRQAVFDALRPLQFGVVFTVNTLHSYRCRKFFVRDLKGAMLFPPIHIPGGHSLKNVLEEIVIRIRAEVRRKLPLHNRQTVAVNTPEELAARLRELVGIPSRRNSCDLIFYCPSATASLLYQQLDVSERESRSSEGEGYLYSYGRVAVYNSGGTGATFAIDSRIVRDILFNVDQSGRAVQVDVPQQCDIGDLTGITFCFHIVLHEDARYTEFDVRF